MIQRFHLIHFASSTVKGFFRFVPLEEPFNIIYKLLQNKNPIRTHKKQEPLNLQRPQKKKKNT